MLSRKNLAVPCATHYIMVLTVQINFILRYSSTKYNHFKRLGIPGPKPWPLVGNMLDFIVNVSVSIINFLSD